MPSAATVERFLKENLDKYSHKDQVKKDILNTVRIYSDLKTKKETFYHSDGRSNDWVHMAGTIPVIFKGTKYNIPVIIWVTEDHPNKPPFCLVQPTATMIVKPGRHVDANGQVFLPYLTDWKSGKSTLVGLIQYMCGVFGEEPPVFSRPSGQAQAATAASKQRRSTIADPVAMPGPQPMPTPSPPIAAHQSLAPTFLSGMASYPTAQSQAAVAQPPTTASSAGRPQHSQALPVAQVPSARTSPHIARAQGPSPIVSERLSHLPPTSVAQGQTAIPPPLPQHQQPPSSVPYPRHVMAPPAPTAAAATATTTSHFRPTPAALGSTQAAYPSMFGMPSPPVTSSGAFASATATSSTSAGGRSSVGLGLGSQLMHNGNMATGAGAGAGSPAVSTNPFLSAPRNTAAPGMPSIEATTVRASLVSAVEDKLRRKLAEEEQFAQNDIVQLSSTQSELLEGGRQIQQLIDEMTAKQNELLVAIQEFQEKDGEIQLANEQLNRLSNDTTHDIDEMVVAEYPLHRQIMELIAEDNAIDDAIFFLNEGLRKDLLTLDVYLKKVRDLSSRQFLLRATTARAQLVASSGQRECM